MEEHRRVQFLQKRGEIPFTQIEFKLGFIRIDLGISSLMLIFEELRVISCCLNLILDVETLNWRFEFEIVWFG